ncbi:LOW QUALITY PROTEIN: hypothetical protein M8C21_024007 [Ambrosia artemisiifolia]|uniref:Uncharacterized protein n=1 Tax=Ambrosia artemisiifolia TaxID=4212 RepID=A0AAD5GXI0_AMBAR|nr:LOW QUALITY PROTEIN: hypothetical protein M8C21_024007 [Ambrosia artemisiifolia]
MNLDMEDEEVHHVEVLTNVDELAEDIMSLDISHESDASNSMHDPKEPTPNASRLQV